MAWARGEIVAIVDDDGLVAPNFVQEILRVLVLAGAGAALARFTGRPAGYSDFQPPSTRMKCSGRP